MNVIRDIGLTAFGDSFTVGAQATNNIGYSKQLSLYIGGTFANYGVGGSLSTTGAKKAAQVLPNGIRTTPVSWMYGLNDIRGGGMAALPKLEGNLRAFLASCFLKTACAASKMRRVGTWTALSNVYGGKAYYCGGTPLYQSNNLSASLEWDFEGDNVVVGAYRTSGAGHYQDLAITIDGLPQAEFELLGLTNETVSLDAKVYRGLGAGPHTIRITPTTLTSHTTVDYVGTLFDAGVNAPVLVSEIPYIKNWPQYNSIATPAICDAANVVINNVVAEFAGLEIEIVKVNDFYDPLLIGNCASDGIHPTTQGHGYILNAFKDKITLV